MGKFTPYKVELASAADGHHEKDFVCDTQFFKNMENSEVLCADIHVRMDMEKKNDLYDLTFRCRGTLQIPCDRCLDPLDHEVDTEYHITVQYGDEYDDASDELLVIPYSDSYLNVAYMLYDTILLTIPIRHVHPQGKCNKAMAAALSKHKVGDDEPDEEDIEDVTLDDIADTTADA